MRIIDVTQILRNGFTFVGIALLIVLTLQAFILNGSTKVPESTQGVYQPYLSYAEGKIEELSEPKTITIHLPGLPEDAKKLEMVLIKPGSFTMGLSKEEQRQKSHGWLPHEVTITKPFYMGKYEVTQAQWEAVMGRSPSYFRGRPNNPVEKVSWRACHKFIKMLNVLVEGTFRLPTEAQWEYACRADTRTQFFFGGSIENADKYMWWKGNNESKNTKEVGLKLPNPWGLYDMHGNVQEWCSDRWELPCEKGPQMDPQGPSSGSSFLFLWTSRVFRGGSFQSSAKECSSSYRSPEQSIDYHYSLGFRLVKEYP